jgi:hypothetical protein
MTDIFNTYEGKAYRFLSFEGFFESIENKNLRFSSANSFNDPLDNSPYLIPMDWLEYNKLGNETFLQIANEYILEKAFKSLYICCFCKEYNTDDSYLMWSHYGQSHSQICFEIDFSKYNYLGKPSEVCYPESLASKREKYKKNEQGNLGLFVVTNKLKQWSYEKEVRLIVDINYNKDIFSISKISNDSLYLFVDFDISIISKIIFGINSQYYNELKTFSLFSRNNLSPIFEKMYIDPISLKLKSKEYNL